MLRLFIVLILLEAYHCYDDTISWHWLKLWSDTSICCTRSDLFIYSTCIRSTANRIFFRSCKTYASCFSVVVLIQTQIFIIGSHLWDISAQAKISELSVNRPLIIERHFLFFTILWASIGKSFRKVINDCFEKE